MNRRDFPGHAAWTETRLNGDHALAFVAVKPHHSDVDPLFYQVYERSHFRRQTDALQAAQDALTKLSHIDEHGHPVFNCREC